MQSIKQKQTHSPASFFLQLLKEAKTTMSKVLQTCFISCNSRASLFPAVHFNHTLLVSFLSTHPEPGCVGWDLTDALLLTTSRLGVVKVLPDVPLTQPTSEYLHKASLFVWTPLKHFHPFIQAWDQNSRSGLRSVARSVVSSDEAYISISSSSFLILCSFSCPPKDIFSCVLLLSPEDEWHIRDGPQLIPSFIVCESKSQTRSSFSLYLFFIFCHLKSFLMSCFMSNRDICAFLGGFCQLVVHCWETETNFNFKARQGFFLSVCWFSLELLQEKVDEGTGSMPFKLALFWKVPRLRKNTQQISVCCSRIQDSYRYCSEERAFIGLHIKLNPSYPDKKLFGLGKPYKGSYVILWDLARRTQNWHDYLQPQNFKFNFSKSLANVN